MYAILSPNPEVFTAEAIKYAPITVEDGELVLPKGKFRKPLPGNQLGLSTSWSGLLTFSSDYPNEPIENKAFNVYVTPFSLGIYARNDMTTEPTAGIKHPAGIEFG